eukprot:7769319-Pyramimonas_sp.AAC.1
MIVPAGDVAAGGGHSHYPPACSQVELWTGNFQRVRDVPGWENLSETDLSIAVDDAFLHEANVHVDFRKGDKWVVERHPLNKRGDEATERGRQEGVETIGVLHELRTGAWFCKSKKDKDT